MENVNESQVETTQEASSTESKPKEDVVAYASFRKSVEAEKAARQKAQELESQLEAIKTAELERNGKHEEIIDSLRSKLTQTEMTLQDERKKYVYNSVTSAIKTSALQSGCTDPDKLIRLLDNDDFSTLQAEDGQVRKDSLNALMEKAKKENHFLFNRGEVKVNDITPKNDDFSQTTDFNKMSNDEKMKALKANLGKALG